MTSVEQTSQQVRLALPSVALEDAFRAMLADYQAAGDWEHHQRLHQATSTEFADYIQALQYQSHGRGLRQGFVPNTMFWLMVGDALVGETNLRHFLTTALLREGGHIGYRITPGWRRQGFGTQILEHGLAQIAAMGIPRTLLTCDTINVASARIIQKNGGQFENELKSFHSGNQVSRYWFETAEPAGEPFPILEETSLLSSTPRGNAIVFVSLNGKFLVLEESNGLQRLPTSPILSHETIANAAWRTVFQQAGLGYLRQMTIQATRPDGLPARTEVSHLDVLSNNHLPRYHGFGRKRCRLRWYTAADTLQLSRQQWRLWQHYVPRLSQHL